VLASPFNASWGAPIPLVHPPAGSISPRADPAPTLRLSVHGGPLSTPHRGLTGFPLPPLPQLLVGLHTAHLIDISGFLVVPVFDPFTLT